MGRKSTNNPRSKRRRGPDTRRVRQKPCAFCKAKVEYIDWKDVENLRRMLTPNGKIHGRKRLSASAREQRMIAQAVKRARYMGLLPYTSATL